MLRYCEQVQESQPRSLAIGFVPGVTPGKWLGRWRDRHPDVSLDATEYDVAVQVSVLRQETVDLMFVRLPVDREGLSVVPLYDEVPVVVASKGHEISLFDEVPLAALTGEALLDVAECGGEEAAMGVAASGAGVVIMPMSLARLYSRKDAVARPVPDAPATTVAIAWLSDGTTADIEEFVGIVRGRTERSSRQQAPEKRKASEKTAAKKVAANKGTAKKASATRMPTGGQEGRAAGASGTKASGGEGTGGKRSAATRKPGVQSRRGRRR